MFSDNNYGKITNTYCTNKEDISYSTYEEALKACRDSADCSAVSDTDCDNDFYYLCPVSTTLKSSSIGSCVYIMGRYFQFIFKFGFSFE